MHQSNEGRKRNLFLTLQAQTFPDRDAAPGIQSRRVPASVFAVAILAFVAFSGCAVHPVKKTTRVATPAPPALQATLDQLVEKINAQNAAVHSLIGTVDLAPTVGSVYSGVISQYHDVKGVILVEKPAFIRIQGQAPVVRTDIFDMVSNGEEFKIFIPSKQQFIVGKTNVSHPAKNAIENLRPQHILEALLIPGINPNHESYYSEEEEQGSGRFYVVNVLARRAEGAQGELRLLRRVWFDRAVLQIARVQFYGPQGQFLEDVQYSNYKDFAGVNYPASIEMARPAEDIRLGITLEAAKFNQPIDPAKFVLNKPENAKLVDLSQAVSKTSPADSHGTAHESTQATGEGGSRDQ